jgi:hypothetical protein
VVKNTFNLEELLPSVAQIKLRSSIDRYGFSHVLAENLKLIHVPRSFAAWVHGWAWWSEHSSDLHGFSKLNKKTNLVVTNKSERLAFISEGFINVVCGGLPFAYVPQQHVQRNDHALLAFPAHSAEVERVSSDASDYFDFLESIKKDFDGIYVSIYSLDWNGLIHSEALKRGLNVIKGANPSDANGLLRVRSMLDSFLHVTSNTMGSHMLYALYSGCSFSFSGPFYAHDESVFLSKGNPHGHTMQYIEKCLLLNGEFYVRSNFGKFFTNHPNLGISDLEFAKMAIGEAHLLDHNQLLDVLGWTFTGQIKGYLNGGARRFLRSINNLT